MVKTIILCLLFLNSVALASEQVFVRVAVIQDEPSISLSIDGPYKIWDSSKGKVIYSGRHLKTTVIASLDKVLISNLKLNRNRLFISPDKRGGLRINGRGFRDNIELINKDSKLLVINFIALEDYIKGVLYNEVSHYWPLEALKAQAIVSRTFALYQIQQNSDKDFDLTSDIYSQVYGGSASERYRTNKAVDQTKGLALTYQGKIFPAYFHATCGGKTEDASALWDIDIAPLKGVTCNFCKDSPHFNWRASLPKNDVIDSLKKKGYNINFIDALIILDRDKTNRVSKLRLVNGKDEVSLSAKDFRNIIGPDIIRSTNFNIRVYKDEIYFEGQGWGHGVGMCQWGAYFMSKQGYNYKDILRYYYPQSDVKTGGF